MGLATLLYFFTVNKIFGTTIQSGIGKIWATFLAALHMWVHGPGHSPLLLHRQQDLWNDHSERHRQDLGDIPRRLAHVGTWAWPLSSTSSPSTRSLERPFRAASARSGRHSSPPCTCGYMGLATLLYFFTVNKIFGTTIQS